MIDRRYLFNVGLLESEGWVSLGLVFSMLFLFFPAQRGHEGGEAEGAGRGWSRHHIYIVLCHDIITLDCFARYCSF